MVIRDSHLQFDKTKISIEADLRKFICNPDKPHICWSSHNTEHKIYGQRKQMQLLLHVHVRISQLLFDKTKINIQTELRELISNPDKMHL